MAKRKDVNEVFKQYIALVADVQRRLNYIDNTMNYFDGTTDFAMYEVESCALQMRSILQALAFSSLMIDDQFYDKHRKSSIDAKSGEKLFRILYRLNSRYWPIAVKDNIKIKGKKRKHDITERNDDSFSVPAFIEAYDACSTVLHTPDAFTGEDEWRRQHNELAEQLKTWCLQIRLLLSTHMVQMADKKTSFLVLMDSDGAGTTEGFILESRPQ